MTTTSTTSTASAPICPRCGGYIPNNNRPGAYIGAQSRVDNKTQICSACGTEEAMEDFSGSEKARIEDWPLDRGRKVTA